MAKGKWQRTNGKWFSGLFAICHLKLPLWPFSPSSFQALCLGLTVASLLVAELGAAGPVSEKTVASTPASRRQTVDRSWKEPLNSDQKILQLLNRVSFGPRPGELERVRRLGISAFLEEQLHPESINDSAAEAKVASLPTLSMSSRELAENVQEMVQRAQEKEGPGSLRSAQGRPSGMAEGSSPPRGGGSGVQTPHPAEGELRSPLPQGQMRQGSQDKTEMMGPRRAVMELAQEELLRAVYSNRQLQEEMIQFWMNHFNIFAEKGADRWLITSFERDTIRPRALGKFEDLLVATAESPAMLFYLDNWLSTRPDDDGNWHHPGRAGRGVGRVIRPWGPFGLGAVGSTAPQQRSGSQPAAAGSQPALPAKPKSAANKHGLNENYARELMELHTLGVDGGYTQRDVIEVARCLTGWTINRPRQGGEFRFDLRMHDPGAKVVLGHKIRAGRGMEDGLEVLHILAHHPSTAHFIALKLCRRFVADDPPPSVVERASRAFVKSNGDLRVVLKTLLSSPEFYSEAAYRTKVKSPLELVASSMRALGAETDAGYVLIQMIGRMGQAMFEYQAPAGFPDRAATWINSGTLLARMNFALVFASNRLPGTTVDWARLGGLEPEGGESGLPGPVLEKLNQQLLQGSLTNSTQESILKQPHTLAAMTALVLASPEFQRR
jgi:uncharacterized protein (DUF1800 family)